jgi:BarA-like signal transduction histidine kinase
MVVSRRFIGRASSSALYENPLRSEGVRVALLLMTAVSAGAFVCIVALPAHSLHGRTKLMQRERTRLCLSLRR